MVRAEVEVTFVSHTLLSGELEVNVQMVCSVFVALSSNDVMERNLFSGLKKSERLLFVDIAAGVRQEVALAVQVQGHGGQIILPVPQGLKDTYIVLLRKSINSRLAPYKLIN